MRYRVRPEVTRDNKGHDNIDVTPERLWAQLMGENGSRRVTRTVAAVFPAGLESRLESPDSEFL
jgi:hypothetical protein